MDSSKPHHFLSGKKILVSGAGVAGLSFALALKKQWASLHVDVPAPTIRIIERESNKDEINRQGYTLSLRSDSPSCGLQSLLKLGLLDKMMAASVKALTESNGGFCIWNNDKDMSELLKMTTREPEGLPVSALRVARAKMRNVLAESLEDIQWGHQLEDVKTVEDGKISVTMKNGGTEDCDILIAADGSNSKVRSKLRPDDQLNYLGVYMILGISRYHDTPPKPLDKFWGLVPSGKGTSLFVSMMDATSALWSVSIKSEQPRQTTSLEATPAAVEAVVAEARAHEHDFPPLFADMLSKTDVSTIRVSNARDKSPFKHDPTVPVFYIGDANHAVSPFAGNGANLAITDGWDLAESLVAATSLAEAMAKYDSKAVPRAQSVLKQSHFAIFAAHATGWTLWSVIWLLRSVNFLMVRFSK